MIIDLANLDIDATKYLSTHGKAAYDYVGSEISSAVGRREWDKAYYLQRLQWRIRKLERLEMAVSGYRSTLALVESRRVP